MVGTHGQNQKITNAFALYVIKNLQYQNLLMPNFNKAPFEFTIWFIHIHMYRFMLWNVWVNQITKRKTCFYRKNRSGRTDQGFQWFGDPPGQDGGDKSLAEVFHTLYVTFLIFPFVCALCRYLSDFPIFCWSQCYFLSLQNGSGWEPEHQLRRVARFSVARSQPWHSIADPLLETFHGKIRMCINFFLNFRSQFFISQITKQFIINVSKHHRFCFAFAFVASSKK